MISLNTNYLGVTPKTSGSRFTLYLFKRHCEDEGHGNLPNFSTINNAFPSSLKRMSFQSLTHLFAGFSD
ncbi:hypothetical protein [Hwangdonia sp.]|uniref:hypothetical protein n=1 Tax=Hwangdonia sp. TaxID=1883432 RepID=UPI003AB73F77